MGKQQVCVCVSVCNPITSVSATANFTLPSPLCVCVCLCEHRFDKCVAGEDRVKFLNERLSNNLFFFTFNYLNK